MPERTQLLHALLAATHIERMAMLSSMKSSSATTRDVACQFPESVLSAESPSQLGCTSTDTADQVDSQAVAVQSSASLVQEMYVQLDGDDVLQQVSVEDYQLDPWIAETLQGYQLWCRAQQCSSKSCNAPFLVVQLGDVDCVWPLDRYIALLPPQLRVHDDEGRLCRLPSVDHVARDPRDLRAERLRYCSASQKASNRCLSRTTELFHNVTKDGALTNMPTKDPFTDFIVAAGNFMEAAAPLDGGAPEDDQTTTAPAELCALDAGACRFGLLQRALGASQIRALDSVVAPLHSMVCTQTQPPPGVLGPGLFVQCFPSWAPWASCAEGGATRLSKTFKNKPWIGAVVRDLVAIRVRGEYAHTSLLRVPPASRTCADVLADLGYAQAAFPTPQQVVDMFGSHVATVHPVGDGKARLCLHRSILGRAERFVDYQEGVPLTPFTRIPLSQPDA
jgi:hypothetical protein